MPTSPAAAPIAVVVTDASWVAVAVSAPVSVRFAPGRTEALVVTFEIEIATLGEIAVEPAAAAPLFALVVIASVDVAVSVRLWIPPTMTPSGTSAVVVSLTTFSATEAPIPTVLPPSSFASAEAVVSMFETAVSTRLPSISGSAVGEAVVSAVTTFRANEPATPTLDAPAPDFAVAVKLDLAGARTSSVTVLPWRITRSTQDFVVSGVTTLIATPTPTPVASGCTVVPSALAAATFFTPVCRLCAPVVSTSSVTSGSCDATYASVSTETKLNASAAEIAMSPSLVFEWSFVRAFGVALLPVEPPGLAFATVLTLSSVSAASDRLAAVIGAAPVLSMNAFVSTVSTRSAIPAPIVALDASPVVVRSFVLLAVRCSAPPAVNVLLPEMCAVAVAVTNASATAASLLPS